MLPEIFSNTYPEEVYLIQPKPVVILDADWNRINESEKKFLEKILSSVKLSLNQVKVVCNAKPDVLQWKEKPTHILVFGGEISGLAKNELLEVKGIKFIVTSSLNTLELDNEAKKKLWNSLRVMFG